MATTITEKYPDTIQSVLDTFTSSTDYKSLPVTQENIKKHITKAKEDLKAYGMNTEVLILMMNTSQIIYKVGEESFTSLR